MKKRWLKALVGVSAVALFSTTAMARDTIETYKIHAAMKSQYAKKAAIGNRVKFYFGTQTHPPVAENLGTIVVNRKTSAVFKSDVHACTWAFFGSLKALRDYALKRGGNAVINIHSYYKKNTYVSNTSYRCGAGATVAGVAFKGTIVKLK